MKLDKKVYELLNKQVQLEFASAYLYLSMSTQFEEWGLDGFANWMRVQYQEEMFHGFKIFDYLHERGAQVELLEIEKPKKTWKDTLEIYEEALEHEFFISDSINKIVEAAYAKKDYPSVTFLDWFTAEQVEEEGMFGGIVDQLKFAEGSKQAIMMLNNAFRARSFNPPPQE